MSNGMLIFFAILGFIVLNELIDAIKERGPSRREREAAAEQKEHLQSMDTVLQDIRQRLVSIERILQQVE